MAGRQGPVRFEIVCTGNICRSPFLHAVLRDAFDQIAPGEFEMQSSGTHALSGAPVHHETKARLRGHGLTLSGYRATQLNPARLLSADVILVMDKEQREHVIDEEPGVARRIFLVKELARLITELDAELPWTERLATQSSADARERWRVITRTAAQARERLRNDDDVLADPFKQGPEAFALMDREASAAVRTITGLEGRLRDAAVST